MIFFNTDSSFLHRPPPKSKIEYILCIRRVPSVINAYNRIKACDEFIARKMGEDEGLLQILRPILHQQRKRG
jgi:hypothetical protein